VTSEHTVHHNQSQSQFSAQTAVQGTDTYLVLRLLAKLQYDHPATLNDSRETVTTVTVFGEDHTAHNIYFYISVKALFVLM
jgi:hypothetical protein